MNLKFLAFILFVSVASNSQAQVLMLDFGPTTASGEDLTNSPGHDSGAIEETQTTWNTLATFDNEVFPLSYSGLVFADNTAAAGVTVNLGTETAPDSSTLSFLSRPNRSSDLGSGNNGGDPDFTGSVLFGSSPGPVGRDGIFGGTALANGLRIDGLSAGAYEVYFVGWNTNENTAGAQMNVYSSAATFSDTFTFSDLSANTSLITNTSEWSIGENYVKSLVTLSAGQSLFLANDNTGLPNNRGFINSVQIVKVSSAGGSYATWASANGIFGEMPEDDFDNDGLSNLLEYAVAGTNPTLPDGTIGDLQNGVITFTKRAEAVSNGDVEYTIETSTDLGTSDDWTKADAQTSDASISFDFSAVFDANFARLKVVLNNEIL